MEEKHFQVYSFDVFDTLIARGVATPEGIFAIMQGVLQDYVGKKYPKENISEKDSAEVYFPGMGSPEISGYVACNFYEMRIGAEQVARNTYCRDGIEDVTLEQIYQVLVSVHQISEEAALFLQALERETEIDNVYGIPENISRVKNLLAEGKKVLLISDMYLDADTIRRMLTKADCIFQDIPLYVSAEGERKNKHSGNLFRYVKEREGLRYEVWQHFGDNVHSDCRVPESLGISCELYRKAELLDIEKKYLENSQGDARKQLMVGCAKLARSRDGETAYALGCGIGGVVLYPYVKWLLEDAVKRGIRRLYFIARDGFIIKEMAETLVKIRGLPIAIKYIYGSRRAWRIPDSENLERGLWDIYEVSFENRIFRVSDLADFLQISETELRKYMPAGLCDERKQWSVPDVGVILRYLLRRPDFKALLEKVYSRKRNLLAAYIRQEIDFSDNAFAFVDMAGSGCTQECLAKVMRQFYPGVIKNYFYRMDRSRKAECDYFVFYPMFVPYYTLFEMMCRAPHEQTIGYAETDGKVVPVFAEVDGAAIVRHGVGNFIQGAVAFCQRYDEVLARYPAMGSGLEEIKWYLKYVNDSPDEKVLAYFGEIPDMLTGREKTVVPYAPKLTDRQIRDIYWYREGEAVERYYKGADLTYSLKRCTDAQRKKIAWYRKYHESGFGRACRKVYKAFHGKKAANKIIFYDYIADSIAVYGAGKLGRRFYSQITGREKVQGTRYHSHVVLWMDQNYVEYQKEGLPVSSPSKATDKDYEQLVIAIAKKETADSIKEMLIQQGVEEYKILWIRQQI